jgi:hypothetical protein
MQFNREEVIEKQIVIECIPETIPALKPEGKQNIMANEKTELEQVFDIDFERAPEKGKACHMQVDEDLHRFLKQEHMKLDVTFRKLANELLCKGIQQYIKVKKLNIQIRNRSKY